MNDGHIVDQHVAGIRSLERGLALLRAVNADPRASVSALGRRIGVPRSTVYRLLATLQQLGYLAHIDATGGYRLQHAVRSLSDGYRDDEWLEDAWSELVAFGERVFLAPVPVHLRSGDHDHSQINSRPQRYVDRLWDDGAKNALDSDRGGPRISCFLPRQRTAMVA